jgi:hypothetical protein
MYGLDISHWSYWDNGNRPPNQQQLEYCRDFADGQGIRRWAISIADQAIARQQIEAIVSFPWPWHYELHTYRYYYFSNQLIARQRDEEFIAEIRRNIYDMQFHWIDVEDENGSSRTRAQNIADLNDIIHFWAGKCRTGVYSAKWVWDILFGNYGGVNYMGLWYADWDWQEKLTLDTQPINQQFGNWIIGQMRQTMGDYRFGPAGNEMLVDTNYFEEFLVGPPPVKPPPEPPIIVPPKYDVSVVYSEGSDSKAVNIILPKNSNVTFIGNE